MNHSSPMPTWTRASDHQGHRAASSPPHAPAAGPLQGHWLQHDVAEECLEVGKPGKNLSQAPRRKEMAVSWKSLPGEAAVHFRDIQAPSSGHAGHQPTADPGEFPGGRGATPHILSTARCSGNQTLKSEKQSCREHCEKKSACVHVASLNTSAVTVRRSLAFQKVPV